MDMVNRRDAIKLLFGGLVQTAGAFVIASANAPAVEAAEAEVMPDSGTSPVERADVVAADMPIEEEEICAAGFRNAAFRNAGFANGGFRNAGFANGGFRNAGFVNGGFHNGGWRNY